MTFMKKHIIFILIFVAVIISFNSKYKSLIQEFESTAISKQALLSQHIQVSDNFIDGIAIHGSIYLEQEKNKDSEFYNRLTYNSVTNSYNLDSINGTADAHAMGNLTGIGRIPTEGIDRDEINLALQFNQFFQNYYEKYPDVTWLYYTSEQGFITIYPWTSSTDFAYSEMLKTVPFYKSVTPENDPLRKSIWTPAYMDEAGKGIMVTLSKPIYYENRFKGVVSLDLTNDWLSKTIQSEYESYLIDNQDTIIAANNKFLSDAKMTKLQDISGTHPDNISEMKALKNNKTQLLDNQLIYPVSFNGAPWRMFLLVPLWLIIGKSIIYTLPIILISVLFLWALHQIEHRKKSEALLKNERELLKTTFYSINEGIIVSDQFGKITMMNKMAEKYTGWQSDEAFGQDFSEVFQNINFLTREKARNPVQVVLETCENSVSGKTVGLISKDGTESYILGSAAPIFTDNKVITGVVVAFRDITKEYEQEREIEGFLNVNLDMLCVINKNGKFHNVNKNFENIMGYGAEALEGQTFLSFVHQEDLNQTREIIKMLLENKVVLGFTNRFRCKDGTYKYLDWHVQPSRGKYIYASARNVTENVLREEVLENIAIKDQLTGLYNRHFLDNIIEHEMEMADLNNVSISMIMLDLDHFKNVNDTWGHPVGDELLKHIAKIASNNIRSSDILVRFGGEEFIILMPQTSLAGAVLASEKIRQEFANNELPMTGRQTASFGVAERGNEESFENWYRRVDEALYSAKATGRNRVVAAERTE